MQGSWSTPATNGNHFTILQIPSWGGGIKSLCHTFQIVWLLPVWTASWTPQRIQKPHLWLISARPVAHLRNTAVITGLYALELLPVMTYTRDRAVISQHNVLFQRNVKPCIAGPKLLRTVLCSIGGIWIMGLAIEWEGWKVWSEQTIPHAINVACNVMWLTSSIGTHRLPVKLMVEDLCSVVEFWSWVAIVPGCIDNLQRATGKEAEMAERVKLTAVHAFDCLPRSGSCCLGPSQRFACWDCSHMSGDAFPNGFPWFPAGSGSTINGKAHKDSGSLSHSTRSTLDDVADF